MKITIEYKQSPFKNDDRSICQTCGAIVNDEKLHTKYHNLVNQLEMELREMRNKLWSRR